MANPLWMMMAGFGKNGEFLLDLPGADNAFDATDQDGQNVSGILTVRSDGDIDWTGDFSGTTELNGTWWSPITSPVIGTWHVKLSYTSGTNQYSSGSGLGAWLEVTAGGGGTRSWTFFKTTVGGPDVTNGVYLLEFSNDGGATTHASVSINDITLTESAP